MNMIDLKAMQGAKTWQHFLFLSENQPGYKCAEPVKVNLTFTDMEIMNALSTFSIFFLGIGNCMVLDLVTAVDREPHVLGDLLKITCKGGEQYIIIAQ